MERGWSSKDKRKPLKDLKQGSNLLWSMFLKGLLWLPQETASGGGDSCKWEWRGGRGQNGDKEKEGRISDTLSGEMNIFLHFPRPHLTYK